MFLVESSVTKHICPFCQGTLAYRDKRIRICRKEGGHKELLMIRRFRCKNCHSYHNELPDCLVPYKHYGTEIISGSLDGIITPEDADSEDYPSPQTMQHWCLWLQVNLTNIERCLRSISSSFQLDQSILFSQGSLLEAIRKQYPDWLEILLSLIYNCGGCLFPLSGSHCAPALICRSVMLPVW